ncbi:MAG: hypothetical protein JHC52_12585 [Chthoniobacterales bacterium]|nr:hypothetical protein [Chthoniobacterales bacterium]
MGGQACVFYGAAQVSKDVDFVILADQANLASLRQALDLLNAERIAVPPLDADTLNRGHAVHFRCRCPQANGLRIDVMSSLRGMPPFEILWSRRTVVRHHSGEDFDLLCVPDLVAAKKTQRSKDWPVIELLVDIHYEENKERPTPDFIRFWLLEARSPEQLAQLAARFPSEAADCSVRRPLLGVAVSGDLRRLRSELFEEMAIEQERDRLYWEPLKKELEGWRRLEAGA